MGKNQPPQKELFMGDGDTGLAEDIVAEVLGDGFAVSYDGLPKNVGVMGDKGVRAHSVLVTTQLEDPSSFVANNADTLSRLANRLTNETSAASRALIDITAGQVGVPFFDDEPK